MKERVAIIGAGMTLFRHKMKETGRELSHEAARLALDSAGIEKKDVKCVVLGSAPDAFDGVHMKGEYLVDGAGGTNKPYMRVFVGGATGVFATIAGWWHVASGLFDVCLVVAEEKMSSCRPHPQYAFTSIWDPVLERPLGPNLLWIFALEMHRYMHVHGIKHEQIAEVSVKNKRNALDHPCAQIPARITVEDVLNSELICYPVGNLTYLPHQMGLLQLFYALKVLQRK